MARKEDRFVVIPLTNEQRDIVQKNFGLVRSFVKRYYNNSPYEDDALSGAFFGLIKAVQKHIPAKGALSTIAEYEMWHTAQTEVDWIKKQENRFTRRSVEDIVARDNKGVAELYSEENLEKIREAIKSLEIKQQILITRVFFKGISQKKISQEENITRAAVGARIKKILKIIRKSLNSA
jgi:RNA polymerase sigma factor (sigma-70 family)